MNLPPLSKLDHNRFTIVLQRVLDGDNAHAADPFVFPAADRVQLESDLSGWKASMLQVQTSGARREEAMQTRDEAIQTFRETVAPAREWVKGTFHRGDERPGEYGLARMPPKALAKMLGYGHFLVHANTQEPPLEPLLPERLLTPIQASFAQVQENVSAARAAVAAHKQAISARTALRKEIEQRVRRLRQHLYTYLLKNDPALADYGF